MKCKRFSLAKRDLVLTKLENISLGLGYLMAMSEGDIKHLRNQIGECICILKEGLSD